MSNYRLIRCGEEGLLAPWSVVCKHLLSGESKFWIPLPSDFPEVDYDWACPECFPLDQTTVNAADFTAVCIHCVKRLRRQSGLPNVGDTIRLDGLELEVTELLANGNFLVALGPGRHRQVSPFQKFKVVPGEE